MQDWDKMARTTGVQRYCKGSGLLILLALLLLPGICIVAKGQTINTFRASTSQDSTRSDSVEIYGVLKDERGNPVINANVTLM